jgi:TRAP-type mannitol/chloroaromatic compound transport system permease small subunit
MQTLLAAIDGFNRRLGEAVSWLALFLVLMTAYNVISRYFFATGVAWQQEIVRYADAIMFLAAAGYTLLKEEHVRIDVCYQHFTPRQKALSNMLGVVLLLYPTCIAIVYFSWEYVLSSWRLLEASNEYQGMPGVFILKTMLWVFAGSLFLQGAASLIRSFLIWRGSHG